MPWNSWNPWGTSDGRGASEFFASVVESGITLCSRSVFIDAAATVTTMIRQSLVSGGVALAANLTFTLGLFWTGRDASEQTDAEFLIGTMGNVSLCMGLAMLLGLSTPLSKFRWHKRPDTPMPQAFWLVRLAAAAFPHYMISSSIVIAIAYSSSHLSPAWQPYQLHFYVASIAVNYYTASLDVAARRLYQTEAVEGLHAGYVNRSPMWKCLITAYRKDFGFAITVFVASGYIHISSRLQLSTQTSLFVFSFASMAFRFFMMTIARRYVLRLRKIHVRMIYVVAAVPTVMINTQVRVALLRVQANITITGIVVFTLIEPLFRMLKVWAVRREIKNREKQSSTLRASSRSLPVVAPGNPRVSLLKLVSPAIVPVSGRESTTTSLSGLPVTPVPEPPPRVQRLLQFTAAELCAPSTSPSLAPCPFTTVYMSTPSLSGTARPAMVSRCCSCSWASKWLSIFCAACGSSRMGSRCVPPMPSTASSPCSSQAVPLPTSPSRVLSSSSLLANYIGLITERCHWSGSLWLDHHRSVKYWRRSWRSSRERSRSRP